MNPQTPRQKILVTGATGYVGGRLVPRLLELGYAVKAAGRSHAKLKSRPWANDPNVELVPLNLLKPETLDSAFQGCDTVYYLVHSMNQTSKDFAETDRRAAQNLIAATQRQQVSRIIYLSGLGNGSSNLSKHLQSRHEVADILQSGAVPVTVLRAAMIIGSGSASFEILRYLVERLPAMVTPRWVSTPNQPIAIRNVIEYLAGCLEHPETTGQGYDIGGPDVLSYEQLMRICAEEMKLKKRWILPLPVLTPKLSSYWIQLVTPIPASLARPLAEGLANPVLCQEHRIRDIIPQTLLSCREAIRLALDKLGEEKILSHWSDAGDLIPVEWSQEGDPKWAGGTLFLDQRKQMIARPPAAVWRFIIQIGGRRGWYHADFLWGLRGFLDRLIGGVGLRRGRRSAFELRPGDALDFWRVCDVIPEKQLLLVAEMKLPGKATLEFELEPKEGGRQTLLTQSARFRPRGLWGILYWYLVLPFHHYVFPGMTQKIRRLAEEGESDEN